MMPFPQDIVSAEAFGLKTGHVEFRTHSGAEFEVFIGAEIHNAYHLKSEICKVFFEIGNGESC